MFFSPWFEGCQLQPIPEDIIGTIGLWSNIKFMKIFWFANMNKSKYVYKSKLGVFCKWLILPALETGLQLCLDKTLKWPEVYSKLGFILMVFFIWVELHNSRCKGVENSFIYLSNSVLPLYTYCVPLKQSF